MDKSHTAGTHERVLERQEYYTNMPVGEILKKTREHYGQSLENVEAALRIRAGQLEALEQGNIDRLPGRVYAIGFVRTYAEYLGLDGEQMVRLFKNQSLGDRLRPKLDFPIPASESRLPPLWLVLLTLVCAVLFAVYWNYYNGFDTISPIPAVEESPEIEQMMQEQEPVIQDPATMQKSMRAPEATGEQTIQQEQRAEAANRNMPVDEAQFTAATESAEQVKQEANPNETESQPARNLERGIILNVIENSWVEIRDKNGNALVSRVLKAGDQYFVPDRPDLTMSLGNAGGIQILIDDKVLPLLGRRGEVRRNISLDVENLKALADH